MGWPFYERKLSSLIYHTNGEPMSDRHVDLRSTQRVMPRHEKEGEAKDLKESNIFLATKGNKKKRQLQLTLKQ